MILPNPGKEFRASPCVDIMSDTIFYSITLKAGKNTEQVFEKIKKAVKPKGVTAKWQVSAEGQSLWIDFSDGASETFCLSFDKGNAAGACKVAFPMGGELFENEKKSEWKKLIAVLHSLRPLCSVISVDDDYNIAAEYFKSLDYPFGMRELSAEETVRLDRLFGQGFTNYEEFLLQIFSEDTRREYPKQWKDALCSCSLLTGISDIGAVWETYLYDTSALKNKTLREIYYQRNWYPVRGKYLLGGDPPSEVYAFCFGVGRLFSAYDTIDNTWGRGANLTKYYYDKFLPLFQQADSYEKCRLAYMFMLSVYDYCKFQYVGKDVISERNAVFDQAHPSDLPCSVSSCCRFRREYGMHRIAAVDRRD